MSRYAIGKFLILSTGLALSACGGSSGGGDGESNQSKSPEWSEEITATSSRYISLGTLKIDGAIFVPKQIPTDQPMTNNDANLYEIRTNKTDRSVTKYSYTWDNQEGGVRSYTSSSGQYYAEFSETLRFERVRLYATPNNFIAYGLEGLEQVNCNLVKNGESTCDAYGQFYTFQYLEFPIVEGTQNIDYAVELEAYLLTQMGLK
tara:strand:- start:7438 stop:8049 length:612 start_codon:yes stop_codon:yes gene_type:complete